MHRWTIALTENRQGKQFFVNELRIKQVLPKLRSGRFQRFTAALFTEFDGTRTVASRTDSPDPVVTGPDGEAACPGATQTLDRKRDVVRQRVPTSCFDGATDGFVFSSSSLFNRDGSNRYASDQADAGRMYYYTLR